MTKTCIICKRQSAPFDKTRSFHKFPNDSELQKKWMQLTGVSIISRNSTVCSDHFETLSFHQTDGYTTVRRLLSNAVPSIALNKIVSHDSNGTNTSNSANDTLCANENSCSDSNNCSEITESKSEICGSVSEDKNFNHEDYCNNLIKDIYASDTSTETWNLRTSTNETAQSLNASWNISSGEEYENNVSVSSSDGQTVPNINQKDCKSYKRKRSVSDNDNYIETHKRKRFRFTYGSQSYCMSREDFTSDDAWNKFIKFTLSKNAQVGAAHQRHWRKEKKIGTMKDLIRSLKENEASAAAEYLEIQ